MRCFVALSAPPEIRAKLAGLKKDLTPFSGMKMVEEENIHLTLKFLGEVGQEKIAEVSAALDTLSCERSFTVSVSGVGAFPNARNPRVVWAGAAEGSEKITALAEKTEKALTPFGFPQEGRFHPHYTIARVKGPSACRGLSEFIDKNKSLNFGSYTVDSVNLMESRLSPKGPSYSTIKKIELKQSPH